MHQGPRLCDGQQAATVRKSQAKIAKLLNRCRNVPQQKYSQVTQFTVPPSCIILSVLLTLRASRVCISLVDSPCYHGLVLSIFMPMETLELL